MMNYKPLKYFTILILLFVIIVTGCRTLPKPNSNIDTLFIIPIKTQKDSSAQWFGKYRITISDSKNNKEVKTHYLPITNGFTTIRGLAPGSYYISEDFFIYDDDHTKGSSSGRHYSFILYPNKISVLDYEFLYKMWKKDSDTNTMNREWKYFSKTKQQRLIESISDYENFSLWNNDFIESSIVETKEHSGTEPIVEISKSESQTSNENDKKLSLADRWIITVLDLSVENMSASDGKLITDLLSSALISTEQYRVIDRSQRETILNELSFSLSGCADESCQLELGKLLAADGIVVGSIGKIGSRYVLNIKLLGVETSEAVATSYKIFNSLEDLVDGSEEIAMSLLL